MHLRSPIIASCTAAAAALSRTSAAIHRFVRQSRRARADLEAVSAELHSLCGVVDLLRDDAPAFPEELARQTPALLRHCVGVLDELDACLDGAGRSHGDSDPRLHWLEQRQRVGELRVALEGYRMALGMALDVVVL
jgi:hypothetical protein